MDSSLMPEKHFEPSKNQSNVFSTQISNETSANRSDPPSFSRHYGWNEIEENDEEVQRLRQLLSVWNAERVAILKLQHDLDKNIFQRTFDYVKRLGQSIGLGLWLWVHRPANCSNISNPYRNQPRNFCCDRSNAIVSEQHYNPETQKFSRPSIDSLPDSLWLRHFVLDESPEYLPPIARAMKNLLDNNAMVWNPAIQGEHTWPHFTNEHRIERNGTFVRNLHRDSVRQIVSFRQVGSLSNDVNKLNNNRTNSAKVTKIKLNRQSMQILEKTVDPSSDTDKIPIADEVLLKPPEKSRKKNQRRSKSKTRRVPSQELSRSRMKTPRSSHRSRQTKSRKHSSSTQLQLKRKTSRNPPSSKGH